MKPSQIIFVVGTFLTSFGGVLLISEIPKWAWWTGKAMVILGPLLTASLGFYSTPGKSKSKAKPRT